jgi:lipopolysaccharide transport system ATP-binding protein
LGKSFLNDLDILMKKVNRNVAIFGTFDVENYGDLLFPIIAKAELSKRLSMVNLHPYSYYSRSIPEWPYNVHSIVDFPEVVSNYDGILIGGGHVIRFEKLVAPGYRPPNQSIHHPTGYWLSPSLVGLQHDVPLIWNAPGFYDVLPLWAKPLLKLTLNLSSYVSVRDEHSATILSQIDESVKINVVPDTAFTVSRLINPEENSKEFIELKEKYCLSKPYIVIQATSRGLSFFLRLINNNRSTFKDYIFIVITIGPAVGDDLKFVNIDLPEIIKLPFLSSPLLIAELICHSEGVVGSSYHLAITALAFGVPVFSTIDTSQGKLSPLLKFERIYPLPLESDIYAPWFINKLGKKALSSAILDAHEQLDTHWDRIVEIIIKGEKSTSITLNKFWFTLPLILEKETVDLDFYRQQLNDLNARLSLRESLIEAMKKSLSFKITKPLRLIKRLIRK